MLTSKELSLYLQDYLFTGVSPVELFDTDAFPAYGRMGGMNGEENELRQNQLLRTPKDHQLGLVLFDAVQKLLSAIPESEARSYYVRRRILQLGNPTHAELLIRRRSTWRGDPTDNRLINTMTGWFNKMSLEDQQRARASFNDRIHISVPQIRILMPLSPRKREGISFPWVDGIMFETISLPWKIQ